MGAPVAAALDLGSTHLKLARLDERGGLERIASAPFPMRERDGLRFEIDLPELGARVDALLELLPSGTRLGIASQRSSFVLWDRDSGAPLCEALSWRDRRAASWCDRHAELGDRAQSSAGLRLSPHYAGPKLAHLLEERAELRARVAGGGALFGTLETYVIWRATRGRVHATDATMAARTLLLDPRTERWSDDWLEDFGARGLVLPEVMPTRAPRGETDGGLTLCASLADQASGLLAVARPGEALINLGTGCFVMREVPGFAPRTGYLCGPVLSAPRDARFALEGTLNGGGSTLERFGAGPTELPDRDPSPDQFCIPDESGVGAPHWIARATTVFAREAPQPALRRAWLEGLVFRLREMCDDVARESPRILVSGGLAREPFVAAALATVLRRPVEWLDEHEATLLGAARLAAGLDPYGAPAARTIQPVAHARWLSDKYERWRAWSRVALERAAN